MDIQELKNLIDNDCDCVEDLAYGDQFEIIDYNDKIDMKWIRSTYYVKENSTGLYYEIVTSCTNSGYWGDSEPGETFVREVAPVKKMVEVTTWKAA